MALHCDVVAYHRNTVVQYVTAAWLTTGWESNMVLHLDNRNTALQHGSATHFCTMTTLYIPYHASKAVGRLAVSKVGQQVTNHMRCQGMCNSTGGCIKGLLAIGSCPHLCPRVQI